MPDVPQPNDGTSIATGPSAEAELGSTTVTGDVLERAFAYWRAVDATTGAEIERLVRADADLGAPGAQVDAAQGDASDPIVETDTHAG